METLSIVVTFWYLEPRVVFRFKQRFGRVMPHKFSFIITLWLPFSYLFLNCEWLSALDACMSSMWYLNSQSQLSWLGIDVLYQVAINRALPITAHKPISDNPQWTFIACYSFTILIPRNSRLKLSFTYSVGWIHDV